MSRRRQRSRRAAVFKPLREFFFHVILTVVITSGNELTKKNRQSATADRYVSTTIAMIIEERGSSSVNLRSISRRLGCAHTNVYNYFVDFGGLLWAAYRRALEIYAAFLSGGLEESETDYEYFHAAISRLSTFPVDNPGLHRFISTDQLNMDEIPHEILETVARMKIWWIDLVGTAAGEEISPQQADRIANVILAYISGESTDIINGRVPPEEDVGGRVIGNAILLFEVLTRSYGATNTVLRDRTVRNRHYQVMNIEGDT